MLLTKPRVSDASASIHKDAGGTVDIPLTVVSDANASLTLVRVAGGGATFGSLVFNGLTSATYTWARGAGQNSGHTETFKFKAREASDPSGASDSNVGTITVTVLNRTPSASTPSTLNCNEGDKDVQFTVTGLDVDDGDRLTYGMAFGYEPQHGRVDLFGITNGVSPGNSVVGKYTPSRGFHGVDGFVVQASDGQDVGYAGVVVVVAKVAPTLGSASYAVETGQDPFVVRLPFTAPSGSVSFQVDTQPTRGDMTGVVTAGSGAFYSFTYKPHSGLAAVGTDTIVIRIMDGDDPTNFTTGTVTIDLSHNLPALTATPLTAGEGSPTSFALAASMNAAPMGADLAYRGIKFKVAVDTAPTQGGVKGDGLSWTYTSNTGLTKPAMDSVVFRIADVNDDTRHGFGTIAITVGTNELPTANNKNIAMYRNGTKVFEAGDDSPEDDSCEAVSIVKTSAHGSVDYVKGNGKVTFTYKPDSDYVTPVGGPHATFAYQLKETVGAGQNSFTQLSAGAGTVDILVLNGPVTSQNSSFFCIPNGGSVDGSLPALDADGHPWTAGNLSWTVTAQPAYGHLTVAQITVLGNFTYVSDGFSPTASDAFKFKVSDGITLSPEYTATFNLLPANGGPPTATPQTLSMYSDDALSITLAGTSPAGKTLTFSVSASPTHGSLATTSNSVRSYTVKPAEGNFSGTDTFTFTASDGVQVSTPATITINICSYPQANDQAASTTKNMQKAITVTGSACGVSPEFSFFAYSSGHGATFGPMDVSSGSILFKPGSNYVGPDGFLFKVDDGRYGATHPNTLGKNIGSVSVDVQSNPGTAPVATNVTTSAYAGTLSSISNATISLNATGLNPLTFVVVSSPQNGTLGVPAGTAITGSQLQYAAPDQTIPNSLEFTSFSPDTFTFRAVDQTLGLASNDATVTVDVTPTPVADSFDRNVGQGSQTTFSLARNPFAPASWRYKVSQSPVHGAISNANDVTGNLTYTPDPSFSGQDSFQYAVSDGTATATGTVTLNVHGGKDPAMDPVRDQTVALPVSAGAITVRPTGIARGAAGSDTTLSLEAESSDPLTCSVLIVIYTSPKDHGTIDLLPKKAGSATITVTLTEAYQDFFTRVTTRTFMVTVTASMAAPTANPQTLSMYSDDTKSITLTGSDPNSLPLTFKVVADPVKGNLSGSGANRSYTVNSFSGNLHGTDSFDFVANNGVQDSAPATVHLNVCSFPVANDQTVSVSEDTPKAITVTGSTCSASPQFSVLFPLSPVGHGTLGAMDQSSGSVLYTPNANYVGSDFFLFKVDDGAYLASHPNSINNEGKVTINVTADADPPTLGSLTDKQIAIGASPVMVGLTGIGRGSANETSGLAVTVSSSDTSVATVTSSYTSPQTTGTVTVTPGTKAGTSTITVTVTEGSGGTGRVTSKTFQVCTYCCATCANCTCSPGSYDIDLTISPFPGCGIPTQNLSGSRTVKPCNGNCSPAGVCDTLTDPGAQVSARVHNASNKCIHVQFLATFNTGGCSGGVINGQYNCGGGGSGGYGDGFSAWFYFCISPGGTVSACMDHALRGANCCGHTGSITGWQYFVACCDSSNCTSDNSICFGPSAPGCPSCLP